MNLHRRNRVFTLVELLVVIGIVALLVSMLLPAPIAIYDGDFDLTVNLSDPLGDAEEVTFALCWNEAEANQAMEFGSDGEVQFRSGRSGLPTQRILLVSYSGKLVGSQGEPSYNEPKWIVVEFSKTGSSEASARVKVAMPNGRGPRSIDVTVPLK